MFRIEYKILSNRMKYNICLISQNQTKPKLETKKTVEMNISQGNKIRESRNCWDEYFTGKQDQPGHNCGPFWISCYGEFCSGRAKLRQKMHQEPFFCTKHKTNKILKDWPGGRCGRTNLSPINSQKSKKYDWQYLRNISEKGTIGIWEKISAEYFLNQNISKGVLRKRVHVWQLF